MGTEPHATSLRRLYNVQYDAICKLFIDPLTKSLRDRQADNLRRIVSCNRDGIHLADLDNIIRVCDLALDAIVQDVGAMELLQPRLCDLIQLLSNGFISKSSSEYDRYQGSVISYLRWIWKAVSIRIENGDSRQLNMCSCDALRRHLNIDQVWQYSMPDRSCQTLPDEFQRWRPMKHFAESGIANQIVKMLIDCNGAEYLQHSLAMLLRDLSMSPLTAVQLLKDDCHLEPALALLLQANRRDAILSLAVETIWNLFEQCRPQASIRLGQDFIVKSFTTILNDLFNRGSSLQDRLLRNQILCTLTFISRVKDIETVFVRAGLIDLLLDQSIELELGRIKSTSFQLEDVEMKRLAWMIMSDLTNDPRCLSAYASTSLVMALLVHTDIESAPASLQLLIDVDRHALTLAAFQLLSVIVPKLHRIFRRANGLKRMSRFLRSGHDRVAELDRVAISVLLKACLRSDDCLEVIEDICHVFTDQSRVSQVRSDLAVLLARVTSMVHESAPPILYTTNALSAAIQSTADVKSSVKLIASSLYIVKQACANDQRNLQYFVQQKGVDLVMQLVLFSPSKELQRASMTFLDDLSISPTVIRELVEYRPSTDDDSFIKSLLNIWRGECSSIKSGCIHGSMRYCYGQCLIDASKSTEQGISTQQISTLSAISRIIGTICKIRPAHTPDDLLQISMIAMYDDIRICNAWSECLQNHGPGTATEQLLDVDLEPIKNRMENLASAIESRINRARLEADQARQAEEAEFDKFADTIRMLIDQHHHPPAHKIFNGASPLVASSRLKLSKEQKKDMCMSALQYDQTMEHILHDSNRILCIGLGNADSQVSRSQHGTVSAQVGRHPDYITDVVLGDPVLCRVWDAMEKIQPGSGCNRGFKVL